MNPLAEFSPDELERVRKFAANATNGTTFDELGKLLGVSRGEAVQFSIRLDGLGLAESQHLDDARPTKLLQDSLRDLDSPPPIPYEGTGHKMETIDHFDEKERKIMRRLVTAIDVNHSLLGYEAVGKEFGMTRKEMIVFVQKLREFKLAESHTNESFRVRRELKALLHDFDNRPAPSAPEPPDRVQGAYNWFSRTYAGAFVIIGLAVLAAIGTVIGNLEAILKWFGISE